MRFLTDDSSKKRDPDVFYFEAPNDAENVAVMFANNEGGLTVAVSEEKPVDSYNDTFECTVYLNKEAAVRLRDYLNNAFPMTQVDSMTQQTDATPRENH